MRLTIPNILTLIRIALIPIFFAVFYLPFDWAKPLASVIFLLASATDWLDGYLARTLKQSTPFGAFLDPVADKVMVAVALVLLAEHYHHFWVTLPAAAMIAREVIISALREWMAEIGKRAAVAVSWVGKVKTTAQMIALTILLWSPAEPYLYLGYAALYIAAILTYWSMIQYLLAAKADLLK